MPIIKDNWPFLEKTLGGDLVKENFSDFFLMTKGTYKFARFELNIEMKDGGKSGA